MYYNKLITKSLFLTIVLSLNLISNAQQKNTKPFEIKAVSISKESEKNLSANFENYFLFNINTESLNKYVQENLKKELYFSLDFPGIESLDIVLRKNNLLFL